ncbi:PREDICTED: uncharacterized protein LOC104777483 [Camelina sativa]|uniref:Uncharacterized protein LOC104719110 n=1 Tax=Camelina sativa TaxID=90675 RepID=A0ABM0U904_CAMSA|nr:PREDICTED: uncharacterized protein LOC104719110 [Camelina sativa]XP_010437717.1 PREDICTED: uncharacterized protein LOC104721435 [Camelina sativa]XP_010500050.1 PREDICTED: uncharacterized protein LOC104777483 [Camelina sativa]
MIDPDGFGGRGEDLLRSLLVNDDWIQIGSLILFGQSLILLVADLGIVGDFNGFSDLYDSAGWSLYILIRGIGNVEMVVLMMVSDGDSWMVPTLTIRGLDVLLSSLNICIWRGFISLDLGRFCYSLLVSDFNKGNIVFCGVNLGISTDLEWEGIRIVDSYGFVYWSLWFTLWDSYLIWLGILFEISLSWFGRWISLIFPYDNFQAFSMVLMVRLGIIWIVMGEYMIRYGLLLGEGVSVEVYKRRLAVCLCIISLWFCYSLLLAFLFIFSFFWVFLAGGYISFLRIMAQLVFSKKNATLVRTETVSISSLVLAQRIQQFSMTLIGRLMNPVCQNMESLIANFPKIWKLEERVVGADLGQGVFQFNFEDEEDILSVLQNGPYHFDGWMVSLVRWEPVISSSYPSAINFWVKVLGIPMHLWEVATFEAVGKKLGRIQEVDEETGSLCVSVNGFNPLIFKMVVPFATGDEIVVSLEYEKLNGVCEHCSRITHDSKVCPEVLKGATVQGADLQRDSRGSQRQFPAVKQEQHLNAGGWEKPRKHAKRALDFQSADSSEFGYFPQQRFGGQSSNGNGSHRPRQQEHLQGHAWGQKRSFGEVTGREEGSHRGTHSGNGEGSGKVPGYVLNRKSAGTAWPKPLFKVKQAAVVEHSSMRIDNIVGDPSSSDPPADKEAEGSVVKGDAGADLAMDFEVDNDDLLEDGEFDDMGKSDLNGVQEGAVSPTQGVGGHTDQGSEVQVDQVTDSQGDYDCIPKGEGNKQKLMGKLGNNTVGTKPSDGGRQGKKGMGALPKPPART